MLTSEAGLIGLPKEEIETPALVIDLQAMEANIAKMASYFGSVSANLRPHFKNHKAPILAKKQLNAGAVGITCAKVEEAEILAASGIVSNILVANQVVDKTKIAKLMGLNKHAEVMVCVDDSRNIQDLSDAAQLFGSEVGVLVEVNVGMNRCGVDTEEEAVELAHRVDKSKGLRFMGLQGYEGHLMKIEDFEERKEKVRLALQPLLRARELIERSGLPVTIVDSGGTITHNITAEIPGIDEIQAGSYLFSDTHYSRLLTDFRPALTLLATIISHPTRDRAIINAGMKALSNDWNVVPRPVGVEGVRVAELYVEHGRLDLQNPSREFRPGDKIELMVGHAETTVNLHDRYYGVRNGRVEVVWEIPGRGKFR